MKYEVVEWVSHRPNKVGCNKCNVWGVFFRLHKLWNLLTYHKIRTIFIWFLINNAYLCENR